MVKLRDIVDALSEVSMDISTYYNKKTNEILYRFAYNEAASTYKEKDEFNEDIIFMFDFYSKNDYDIMLDFIETIDNESLGNELYNNIRGKGAFKRFRYIIDSNNMENDWYSFLDNKYKEIAKEWCLENNIKYED